MSVFETKYDRDIHVLQERLVKCRALSDNLHQEFQAQIEYGAKLALERDALLKRLEAAEGLAQARRVQLSVNHDLFVERDDKIKQLEARVAAAEGLAKSVDWFLSLYRNACAAEWKDAARAAEQALAAWRGAGGG